MNDRYCGFVKETIAFKSWRSKVLEFECLLPMDVLWLMKSTLTAFRRFLINNWGFVNSTFFCKNLYLTGTFHSPHVCWKFARIYDCYRRELPRPLKLHWQNIVQSLMEDFSCNAQSTECMDSTCVNCPDLELNLDGFHNNKESINFHQRIRVDNKIQKSEIELPCDEICQKFNNDLKLLKKHLCQTSSTCVL